MFLDFLKHVFGGEGFGHVPRPRRGLQADGFRIPRARMRAPLRKNKNARLRGHLYFGGEGGIRTLGWVAPSLDFESSTIDHSATSPAMVFQLFRGVIMKLPESGEL
jgi:hypothetical protein